MLTHTCMVYICNIPPKICNINVIVLLECFIVGLQKAVQVELLRPTSRHLPNMKIKIKEHLLEGVA